MTGVFPVDTGVGSSVFIQATHIDQSSVSPINMSCVNQSDTTCKVTVVDYNARVCV